MATETKIQWATHTASPWYGCSRVHTGCTNCYAEALAKRNPSTLGVWGPHGTRVLSASFTKNCRKWNKAAEQSGVRSSVFPSLCDPFEEFDAVQSPGSDDELRKCSVCGWFGTLPIIIRSLAKRTNIYGCPHCDTNEDTELATLDDVRRDLFATIDACPMLDFMLLTKRPGNVRTMWSMNYGCAADQAIWHRPNVHLIYSASDQASLESGIGDLLACRDLVPVLGLSLEPLVGPIELPIEIDWSIVGGESGPGARPCNVDWIRSIVAQCKAAGVACFVKQLGSRPIAPDETVEQIRNKTAEIYRWPEGTHFGNPTGDQSLNGRCILLKDKKGGDWDEWSKDLRVREFPH